MEDILAAIEVVGAGKRTETGRLYLRTNMRFIAPFGPIEASIWNANLSTSGIAIQCQTPLLSQDLIDSIWTIELFLQPDQPAKFLSLSSQLVRISPSGWVAFQFVCVEDEDLVVIESLIQRYSASASIEEPLDLAHLAHPEG